MIGCRLEVLWLTSLGAPRKSVSRPGVSLRIGVECSMFFRLTEGRRRFALRSGAAGQIDWCKPLLAAFMASCYTPTVAFSA